MRILVNRNGQQLGPYTQEEASAAVQSGALSPTDLAWAEGTPSWVPLSTLIGGAAPVAPPSFAGAAAVPIMSQPKTTAPSAIWSLVLGILGFLCCYCFTGIPAVICGHVARGAIKREPQRLGGSGIALAGLILGYFSIAVSAMLMILSGSGAMDGFQQGLATANAHSIAVSCQNYAVAHDGTYPNSLEELVPTYLPSAFSLKSDLKTTEAVGFDYLLAGKKNPDGGEVLIVSHWKNKKGEQIVGHVDGSSAVENYP